MMGKKCENPMAPLERHPALKTSRRVTTRASCEVLDGDTERDVVVELLLVDR